MQRALAFLVAASAYALVLAAPLAARAQIAPQWSAWNTSSIVQRNGYPVFEVDGKPFFVYGAAFFYERIPRAQWRATLQAYKALGINTLDIYAIWNWHEPAPSVEDFTGRTDPRRDLLGVFSLAHELGFKIVLRPGPVIRNEWRNGGYPDWLLERQEYGMPLHDVLEGRYPATATLQNVQADAAASEWLHNATHLEYAGKWLSDILGAVAPYAGDVIAIALDDDQGAYLDNDTWPAPHWHAYVDWLRLTVRAAVGSRVPLFINTFETKVPAAAPAWAWGDWYQSDAYSIGEHDLAELDFATGLLQTQPHRPVMQAEFQAGWLQGAGEAAPRPADPTNTALALAELLRDGAHGIVNFPVQDTIDPAGWEAPWANWSYAWDAALTIDLHASPRYAPTAQFGRTIARYGTLLARTHVAADAAIVWPPSLFSALTLTNADFAAFAAATIALQRQCANTGLTCELVDLAYADDATLARYPAILLPIVPSARLRASIEPPVEARLMALRRSGQLVTSLAQVRSCQLSGAADASLLLADDASYGFVVAVNPSTAPRRIGPLRARLRSRTVRLPAFTLAARSVRVLPLAISARAPTLPPAPPLATPPPFADPRATVLVTSSLRVAFAPDAGARIAELSAPGGENAATSIGLLRDAVDPQPTPSVRDYIAAYTHPLPAGTFNRPYRCTAGRDSTQSCSYDAPDLPDGGARFQRTYAFAPSGDTLIVDEKFAPNDASSAARLVSISGFAFDDSDALIAPNGIPALGVLHGHRLAVLRWRSADVASVTVRATRGAQLVTLVFARRRIELRLAVATVADAAEAERLLRANPQ